MPNAEVVIEYSEWTGAGWLVRASIRRGPNTWSGPHVLDLPESATPADLEDALGTMYAG